ncbi:EthD family reductase [Caballeronia sp. LP006]|uniref:EthD family reductase n=1 Tax=Caballeronia sp. LP006 TaxID=3038552 RepID=UPI0028658694|nr:EthD family reductase [Caballeronia sp. LP006]MDR5832253.1 EthD family reductase [Caballeronia sp. LP006]
MTRESETSVTVYVTYSGSAGARFDRTWYVERHLPLVMTSWSQYGLEEVTAFFPAGRQTGTLAICQCRFRDQGAVDAAFSSPEASAVMADVLRFTDIAPQRARAVSL